MQPLDAPSVGEQRQAGFDHVLGQALCARPVAVWTRIHLVDGIGEFDVLTVGAEKRDIEIFRVQQLADDGMQIGIEMFEAARVHRQFGNPEQGLLQFFGALALHHFGLQLDIGFLQRLRAFLDAAFQILLRGLAVERGENVLRHIFQQGAVFDVVAFCVVVVLDHDGAADLCVAQQRYAQPVLAQRAASVFLPGDVQRFQDGNRRADERLSMPQQRCGHAVHALVDAVFGIRIRIELVAAVGEVEIADGVVSIVVQDDIEVLSRHQSADDLMDPRQHVVHFQT